MFDTGLKWDMEMQVDSMEGSLSFFISLSGIDIEKG